MQTQDSDVECRSPPGKQPCRLLLLQHPRPTSVVKRRWPRKLGGSTPSSVFSGGTWELALVPDTLVSSVPGLSLMGCEHVSHKKPEQRNVPPSLVTAR